MNEDLRPNRRQPMLRIVREYTRSTLQTAARLRAALAIVCLPLSVSLDNLAIADGCTPPSYSTPGVHVPTGSDAAAFTYDCASGMWVSAHFIYNPNTDSYIAKDTPVYTYNPGTGQYDYQTWE